MLKCLVGFILTVIYAPALSQDFTTISWDTAASQPYPVYESQGVVVNDKLYTFGGFDQEKINKYGYYTPTSRAYVYNPISNTWAGIASMPPMNGTNYGGVTHAGFTTDSIDIYFAGGYTSNATGTGQIFGTKEVWKYIVVENRYVSLPNLPRNIGSGQLKYLNGKLHHIAGFPGNPNTTVEVGDHYVLDLNNLSDGWKTLAPLPNPRNHPGSSVYAGKLYFMGGQHGNDEGSVTQKDLHVYDPDTNIWTKLADMPVPNGTTGRAHISSSVILVGSRIFVIGGETSHEVRTNMVSAYSPATDTWQNLTPFPKNISGGVAANIGGNIYYTGGPYSKATYKGTPEGVILSSAAPANVSTSGEGMFDSERNLKKPVVYPNPMQKRFNIRFPANYKGNFSLIITDQSGRTYNLGIIKVPRGGSDINMDISKLSLRAGLYFLRIKSETRNEELKLIVQ